MANFDPDAYLASAPAFDPDAYLGTAKPKAMPTRGELLKQEASDFIAPLGNLAAGAVRGAGSLGATLLVPWDIAKDAAAGKGVTLESNRARRQAMTDALQSMGADPESLAFKGGKIVAEIAGTAAVPGVLAGGAKVAGASPAVVNALRTAGMSGPNLATRAAAGAATGATAAGMVNPEDAGIGAAFGAALPVAGALAKGAVAAGRNIAGATTGVGDEALRTAYASGKAGGAQAQSLRENMRGSASMLDVLDDAKANLADIRAARSAAYKQNMAAVKAVQKPLDMAPIDKALNDSLKRFTFKGLPKDPEVFRALKSTAQIVDDWKKLPPSEYHTPEGIDALKQQITALRNRLPIEDRASRAAIDNVVNTVKRQIESEAPEYAKAMKDYHQASELIDEISRSLSLNDRASADTAMRKLQSVMRNNVNTNYGARANAMQALEDQGGRNITSALAGQALNDWMPRGIQRATGAGLSLGAGSIGGLPAAAGAAAMSSPRLMGEAAYLTGTGARVAAPLIQALRAGTYRAAPVLAAQ